MSMKDKAYETASNISELMDATPEQEKAIKDAVYRLLLDLRVEFLRVAGNCLERKILEKFEGANL